MERGAATSQSLPLTWSCEGTWECQVERHPSAILLSLFHIQAQRMHSCHWVGYLWSHDADVSYVYLAGPLPHCATAVDVVATETGQCWHGRTSSDLLWRPHPQHSIWPLKDLWGIVILQLLVCWHQLKCLWTQTLTHKCLGNILRCAWMSVLEHLSVFHGCITKMREKKRERNKHTQVNHKMNFNLL